MISNRNFPVYPSNENEKIGAAKVLKRINQFLLPEDFDKICIRYPEYKFELCYRIFKHSEITAIHQAISHKNYKLANHIAWKLGSKNVDVVNGGEITAFYQLTKFDHCKIETLDHWNLVKTLLDLGANVNLGKFLSPLRSVANSGDVKFTTLLLNYGAKKLETEELSGWGKKTYKTAKEAVKVYNDKKCLFIFNLARNLPRELVVEIACLFKNLQFSFKDK